MFPLEVPKKCLIDSHPYAPAIKYLHRAKILVYSVAWHMIYLIPDNMLQNKLLPIDLNDIQKVHHWVIWIGSITMLVER